MELAERQIAADALRRAKVSRHAELERRLSGGERVVGRKIALTSMAAQQRVGTNRPTWGWLTDAMERPDGSAVSCDPGFRIRAEAELVFVLGQDLVGPGVTTRDVLDATLAICAGIEVPRSPLSTSPPSLSGFIAGNASAHCYVVRPLMQVWTHLDLSALEVQLDVDGQAAETGTGAAVLGHPARAIAQVANDLASEDYSELRAGELIFSGGLTEPVTLRPGMTISATFAQLGLIGLKVSPQ